MDLVVAHPVVILAVLAVSICLYTRISSGRRLRGPNEVKKMPYWIPYLGHGLSLGLKRESFLASQRDVAGEGIFAIYVAGKVHNMITSPSLAKQLWLQRTNTVSSQMFLKFVMERFFGQQSKVSDKMNEPKYLKGMHASLNLLQKEPQLTDLITWTIREVENEVPNLSAFLPGEIDQPEWERSANSELVAAGVVEVDIFPLLRNFVGAIATKVLLGEAFLRNNPNILNDIWTLDNRMNEFYIGVPVWMPQMTAAYAARYRIHQALKEFSTQYAKVLKGEDADYMWGEMNDVSEMIKQRTQFFLDNGLSPRDIGPSDLAVLWVMNINSNSIIYWLLMHIISDKTTGLESKILKETSPFVKILYSNPDDPDFIAPEPPRLKLDLDGLLTKCSLLQSAYWETLRLDSYAWGYNEIMADITIHESAEDATISSPSNTPQPGRTYTLRKGELVAIPYGAHHTDPRYFDYPTDWIADRFLVKEKSESSKSQSPVQSDVKADPSDAISSSSNPQIDTRTVRPFGGGASMCKGRLFAEREVLAVVAGVLHMYVFEPAGGKGGDVLCPSHKSETHSGTYQPASDVSWRLRMRHRGR